MNTIINIGRQFGSGGKSVVVYLGGKLGIPVYDGELINQAAKRSGIYPEIFEKTDERRRFLNVGGIFGAGRHGGFSKSPIGDSELFRIQSEAIRALAEEGSAIFLGRASDYVLRDMKCTDVFICAPLEERIRRVSERMGISAEKARQVIAERERSRENYYNYFTLEHWGVASNYDLCIDSSILGIEGTGDFIIDFINRI